MPATIVKAKMPISHAKNLAERIVAELGPAWLLQTRQKHGEMAS